MEPEQAKGAEPEQVKAKAQGVEAEQVWLRRRRRGSCCSRTLTEITMQKWSVGLHCSRP
jgi:hypothetical protein